MQQQLTELESLVNVDAGAQRKHIEELLPLIAKGDIRRGHGVFYSAKASCSACHRLGYAGGTTGPELTHIGQTRTERDLLEAITGELQPYTPVDAWATPRDDGSWLIDGAMPVGEFKARLDIAELPDDLLVEPRCRADPRAVSCRRRMAWLNPDARTPKHWAS